MIQLPRPPLALRVLLVDDSPVNQKLITGLLRKLTCAVSIAKDGQQAVERVFAERFDIVLMDVQMPVMDGLTATRLIRQREDRQSRIPIIAVTAGMDRQTCLEAGMDAFLGKPLQAEALRSTLRQFATT